MPPSTKRVLVYRLGSLGDTLIALPALHLIARAFPNAERRLLTNFPVNVKAPPAASILEHTGLIHGYFRYLAGTRNPLELLSLWWRILLWRPDVLIYMAAARGIPAARRDARFFKLCRIPTVIGLPLTEDLQHNLDLPAEQALEPEAARLARALKVLGDANLDAPASWDLHLTSDEQARADEVLAPIAHLPILAVSVGTKCQSKDWGRDKWHDLLARLAIQYPHHALVLLGAAEESEASDFASAGWLRQDNPAINLCGVLSPRESAAVLARAQIFLGLDSGPMHLAAAVQTPCVAIFSARNKPRVWFPYGSGHRVLYHQTDCWGCNLETCIVQQRKCLTSITVDEVLSQVFLTPR